MTDITLGITLKGDGSGLVGQVKLSAEEFKKLGASGQQAGQQASRGMDSFGSSLSKVRSVLGALGLGFGLSQIVSFARRSLEAAGAIGELAEQLGVTAENLQVYQFAATQSGISTGELEGSLQIFNRTIGDAATGSKEAAGAFKRLGIDIDDAGGRIKSSDQLIRDAADAISRIEDPARRAAAANDLFGRSGQRLLTILSGGSERLSDFEDKARELGLVLSNDFVRQADEASDQLSVLYDWASKLAAIGTINLAISVGLVDSTLEQDIAAIQKRIELAELGFGMFTGDSVEELREELGRLLDQQARQGFKPQATGAGGSGSGGGRAGEIETIDVQVDSLVELMSKMREEVELLGMSARARGEEIAVRQVQDAAMKEGRLATLEEIEAARELHRHKQAIIDAEANNQATIELTRKGLEAEAEAARELSEELKRQTDVLIDFGAELANSAFGFTKWKDLGAAAIRLIASELQKLKMFGGPGGGLFSEDGLGGLLGEFLGSLFSAETAHSGGMIGRTAFPRRTVPRSLFANAPRFHGGGFIGSDEVPIIAQRGEVIGHPSQFGGGDTIVQVIDQRGKGAPIQVEQRQGPDGLKILRMFVRDELNGAINDGAADGALARAYGLRRVGFSR